MALLNIIIAASVASFSCEVEQASPDKRLTAAFTSDFLGMYLRDQGSSSARATAFLIEMGEVCLNGMSCACAQETMIEETAHKKAVVFICPIMKGGVSLAIASISYFL